MIKVGTIVGDRYEILEKIGVGGMAEVFKGKDHKLNRYVAVKVLKEEFRENDAFVKKFKEEAQAAARLAHPNIVNVYDVGDENGIYYIVMELVEGITLKNYIERKGSLTIKEATSIAIQVCAGLEVAHNNHIVHRDIKPQNIIISRGGKGEGNGFWHCQSHDLPDNHGKCHGIGTLCISGTGAAADYVDHRSDIYSLGIVLYEMVTGRVPFDGETAVTVAVKHLQEEMVPPSVYCKNIPYSLEQIIKKCTEKSPDRRYQDIGDLLADLKQSLMDPDGDFVQMIDVDEQARTVVMNKGTSSKIRNSRKVEVPVSRDEDEDEEDDEYEDDEDDEDEDDDEELSPAVEKAMTVAGVVLAVIIVLIVLLLVSKALGLGKEKNDTSSSDSQQTEQTADEDTESEDGNSSSANTVVMPNLLGKTMTEAKIELKDLGIDITLKGSESSSKYSAGQIMEQNIAEGTKVEVGSSVEVTIAGSGSSGTSGSSTSSTAADSTSSTTDTEVTVPNVVGKDEATARAAIEAAGLTVGTVTEAASDTVTSGLVISQTVAANTKTAKGTKVNLVLSSGPSSVKVTDVIGHEQSRAEQELAAAGFQVSVKEAYSSDVRPGLVISTTPDRGTPAKPGSTVTMTVSQGKEKVTIPSVSVGMTYEAAAEKLEDAGFTGTISEATESSDSVGSGFVTRYSPSGTVDPDGTVTIYVSTGSASGTGTDGTEGMPAN